MGLSPGLSLCMVVRDEERHLPACLESTRDLVDERIVVDTGSTDRSIAIARAHGALVISDPWRDDFAAARNAGLERASRAWILVLDADEVLPAESRAAIRALAQRPPAEAYSLLQTSAFGGSATLVRVAIVRLFPNHPRVRFRQAIHEQVNASLAEAGIPIHETAIAIDHHGYRDAVILRGKKERNNRITFAAFSRDPDGDPHLRYHYATALADQHQWIRAAEEFSTCACRCAATRPELASAARLRAAECFLKLGDTDRALAHLPGSPAPDHHPRALVLRAEIETARGNIDAAHAWYAAALGAPNVPVVPPVPLEELKLKVLLALGNYWGSKGRKDVGAGVLKLALEVHRGQRRAADVELLREYASLLDTNVVI